MKPFNVSTTSRWFTRPWHVQLATTYGTMRDSDCARRDLVEYGTDICSYTNNIFWGLMYVLLMTTMFCGVIVAPIADASAWVAAGIISGFVQPNEVAMLVLIMIAIVAVVAAIVVLVWLLFKIRNLFPVSHERSLVGQMYDSWKNKYCVQLTFTSTTKVPE